MKLFKMLLFFMYKKIAEYSIFSFNSITIFYEKCKAELDKQFCII